MERATSSIRQQEPNPLAKTSLKVTTSGHLPLRQSFHIDLKAADLGSSGLRTCSSSGNPCGPRRYSRIASEREAFPRRPFPRACPARLAEAPS